MTAYVPKEVEETILGPGAGAGRTNQAAGDVSSDRDSSATPRDLVVAAEATSILSESRSLQEKEEQPHADKEDESGMSETNRHEIPGGLIKYKVEDSIDPSSYHSQDMLHYLGRPVNEEAGFGMGNNGGFTRERLRQFATARLAEQERRVMEEADFLFQREASARQHKVNATVASKPLYPIGAPQRVRMPKQTLRLPDHPQRQAFYDGPLNLVKRPVVTVHPYGVGHPSMDSSVDHNKPLDLSIKSERRVSAPRAPKLITEPRLISMANAERMASQSRAASTNGHGVTSQVTTTQTMYRPPPMMSYGRSGRHGNGMRSNPSLHRPHSLLPKDVSISQGQLYPLSSTGISPHIQPSRGALKRPAPLIAHSASEVPLKRAVHESDLNLTKVAPSSSIPTSMNLHPFQEASRAAGLAYERGRTHAVSLINQQNSESPLRITDVRSVRPAAGAAHPAAAVTSGQARSRPSKSGDGAPVFHHIHYHHHHHHVPQTDDELLRPGSNGTTGVPARTGVPKRAGILAQGVGAAPANGIPAHEIPIHRLAGRVMSGREVPAHGIASSSLPPHEARPHSVLIKHASNPVSTITSPHLRRAHYRTRRRYRSISPPTPVSISGVTPILIDSVAVTSTSGRVHQHTRAASPLNLVASSMAAGAKMNELLKPLDGPEQPTVAGHGGTNNNNNKVLLTDKLARPLRVDIPDDRAFVSHLGGVYSGQANPVPLIRQVSNAANITKCLTSDANSSPKKSNSSGNESPTMPVLTPQSVYSPCFTTESATNVTHKSSGIEPQSASSPVFYNALTLPLYSCSQDISTAAIQKLSRVKDESPPNLQETSPEQLVPDHHVPSQMDSEASELDRRAERNRVESALHRQIDSYFLDAVDKNKREHRRLYEETLQKHPRAEHDYQRHMQELGRESLENRNKPRKRHVHTYGLKASMDKLKTQQSKKTKERIQSTDSPDDRNIFAELMLQRQWYEAKTGAKSTAKDGQRQQADVIDLTSSPSSSPAPDVLRSFINKSSGSGGISTKQTEIPVLRSKNESSLGYSMLSVIGEAKTVSVSEAIDAVFAAELRDFPCGVPDTEERHPDAHAKKLDLEGHQQRQTSHGLGDLKDPPPKLVSIEVPPQVSSIVTSSVHDTRVVSSSANNSSVLPPSVTENGVIKAETSLACSSIASSHQSVSLNAGSPSVESFKLSAANVDVPHSGFPGNIQGSYSMTQSSSSLHHHLRYSPTEKTFSHDPRKKLLAAMSVHTPTVTTCAVSPASTAASMSSTLSPSSGRSTPSKSSLRKRSLEISRLENTSSYVAEIPKRRQTVDLLTDPSLLDREERALQRAMKRFNEMEQREKVTPTDTLTDSQTHSKRNGRPSLSKYSPSLRKCSRGRGRKFMNPLRQSHIDDFTRDTSKGRRSFSREMRRLTSGVSRSTFQDFVPLVLEERTRHSLATRSSARERKAPYHKNARYEMEIEKEERKYLERKRQKRSVSGSTSGEEEPSSSRGKMAPGRRRRGGDDVIKTAGEANLVPKEQPAAVSCESDANADPPKPNSDCVPEGAQTEEGVAKSSNMDTPLHVVIDPTNLTKMKFMTSSAYYELHRKDSGKENKDGSREEIEEKPGGKRKFKTKHLGPATFTKDTDVRQDENTIKPEVLDDPRREDASSLPSPEPSTVKVVRPRPPAEMKRLMVNKKLGETILHRAARLAYDDVAIYCIDYDVVDINAKDNAGYTPLHECCVHGRLRVALHLLQHGADVNASASDGTRPIHDAVDNNWLALVRLLLAYGADPLIATYSGRTTIKLARTKAMKTFIIGYLHDINGDWELDEEDPYQSNLDLCWHLAETHSFDANDMPVSDIFQDVPEEKAGLSEGEFLFELSDTPHLTSYNICLPNDRRTRNWLLLTDVTNQLNTTRMDFLASNRTLRRATMTQSEFASATKDSQLNCVSPEKAELIPGNASGDQTVEIVELTSELRRILHIEEEYV